MSDAVGSDSEGNENYLRVDFDDDDVLLSDLIEQGQQICMDVARITDEDEFENLQGTKIAVQYAAAYLYEHRRRRITISWRWICGACWSKKTGILRWLV